MQHKLTLLSFCATAIVVCAISPRVFGDDEGQERESVPRARLRSWVKPPPRGLDTDAMMNIAASGSTQTLPLSTFFVDSSRDGNHYRGVLVGTDPFHGGGSTSVPTYIVPLIIRTSEIGTSVDPKTGVISTTPGVTVFNPTVADTGCLTSPNDVPLTLLQQSPIFKSAAFNFGGTHVGTTQYVDAFQRANFWKVDDHATFHVLLSPVNTLAAIVLDVPRVYGLALSTLAFGPPALCARVGIVDINWFDSFLTNTIIPALAAKGVNPTNLPIFLAHNLVWASPVTNLNTCCIGGYHSVTGVPVPIQTYSVTDFDTTGFFGTDPENTLIISHEVAEWMNDPFITNEVPPWGNVGQVRGCDNLLEVGDPLSFAPSLRIAMPNGFTYHLQELAFFSWFFGAPSIGIHGWFSDNATFLTDAGPPCH